MGSAPLLATPVQRSNTPTRTIGVIVRLNVDVLGPLRVRAESAEIEIRRPSHRRLLLILALDIGRRIDVPVLIDRYWEDTPPPTAKAALQTHVSALRKSLGASAIITEDSGYRLELGDGILDADAFQLLAVETENAARGREWNVALSRAVSALDLWRGRPFEELDNAFAQPQITKLEEIHNELLERRAEALIALDRPSDALPDLEGLVIEYPLRERLWEHLMTARYRLGRHTEALRAYGELSEHLSELGLVPGERLRRLEDRILIHDSRMTPTRNNLPIELSSFIGREQAVDQTRHLLSERRLVTLTGPGGSGKTRLAIQATRGLLGEFWNGVWLVELAATENPALITTQVASAMGLKPSGQDALAAIKEASASGDTLIVLDNCEHLLRGAASAAEELLQSSPELKILATSREPLRVPGESVYDVPGMDLPSERVPEPREALRYESIQLFEQRAKQADPSFRIHDRNVDAVVKLCRQLDGLPLALELAAARTPSMSVESLVDRLDNHLQLLTTGSTTGSPRQRTLEATIAWSYRLLDDCEKTVISRLSVFRGGFQLDAAEQVVAGTGVTPSDVAPIVSDLVNKSLVSTYKTRLGTRYRLLETVRQFAVLRLEETSEVAAIQSHHQEWCLSRIADLWERALGAGRAGLSHTLDLESDNLQVALARAEANDDRITFVELSLALGWHWYLRGDLTNASRILRSALSVTNDPQSEARTRALLARCLAYSEDIPAAFAEAETAHSSLSSVDSPLTKTWIISTLLLCHFMSVESDPASMLPLADEADGIAGDSGDSFAEILADQALADAFCWNGMTKEGLETQRITLDKATATGDVMTINDIFGQSIYNYMLDPVARRTEPLRITEEWLSLVPLDTESWISTATDWLPWVYMQVGDFDRASEAAARMGVRILEGYNRTIYLIVRSTLSWMRGNLRDARNDIEELDSRGVSPRWAHTYYPLAAEVAADLGRLDDVRDIVDTHLAMAVHTSREATKLGVLNPLVRAEIDRGLDIDSSEHTERARRAIDQMRRLLHDHPPRVDSWTSVMTHSQNLAFADAEMTRAAAPSPRAWAAAASAADYAYYRLYARWRRAEALLQTGETEQGTDELREVYIEVVRLGARLLRSRVEKTARHMGVALGTPRSTAG